MSVHAINAHALLKFTRHARIRSPGYPGLLTTQLETPGTAPPRPWRHQQDRFEGGSETFSPTHLCMYMARDPQTALRYSTRPPLSFNAPISSTRETSTTSLCTLYGGCPKRARKSPTLRFFTRRNDKIGRNLQPRMNVAPKRDRRYR